MAERNATTVRVHPGAREAPERMLDAGLLMDEIFVFHSFDVTEHLCRKRFVNFPKCNVIELQLVSRKQSRYGGHRRHQEPFGEDIERGHLEIPETRAR